MTKFNPLAILFWAIAALSGYLFGGSLRFALLALLTALVISLLASFVPTKRLR